MVLVATSAVPSHVVDRNEAIEVETSIQIQPHLMILYSNEAIFDLCRALVVFLFTFPSVLELK